MSSGYNQLKLNDMLDILGEDEVKIKLSEFSCPLNQDVEYFLHDKAIEFSKQHLSVTYLIYTSYKGEQVLVGYYALANKTINIYKDHISKSMSKRVSKFATFDSMTKRYTMSAPLIGQLSKNFHKGYNKLITGAELLKLACDQVITIQGLIGGKVVYLECENNSKLVEFYKENRFVVFGERHLDKDESSRFQTKQLLQLLRYL